MVDRGSDELLLEMHKAAKQYARHPKVNTLLQWANKVTAGSSGNFKPAAKRAVAILIPSDIAGDIADDIARASDFVGNIQLAINSARNIEFHIKIPHRIKIASDIKIDSDSARVSYMDGVIAFDIDRASESAIDCAIEFEKLGICKGVELCKFISQLQIFQSVLKESDIAQIKKISEQVLSAYLRAFHLTPELITYNDEESQALDEYLYSVDLLLKCKQEASRLSPATWEAIEAELLLPPDD
jgi:hypothetical protein